MHTSTTNSMRFSAIATICLAMFLPSLSSCSESEAKHEEVHHKIVATRPEERDVVTTEEYVCQIHSCRHIEVCALEGGYLEAIPVKEGQAVKHGESMFKILPTLFQARLDSDVAEAELAQIEYTNTENLFKQNVVSDKELALAKAKLAKAQAKVELARAELNFTNIAAPFDGIIDRLYEQQGSLIEEGDMLTTLSDNSVMWVYFNVPEARYLEYKAELESNRTGSRSKADEDREDEDEGGDIVKNGQGEDYGEASVGKGLNNVYEAQRDRKGRPPSIELRLANGKKFEEKGEISAIEADFNNETGNIAFRADFPNPTGLLRHGQTGTILIHRTLNNALVIPQRATFEILDKRFVFVVGEDEVAHQREISILHEMEDIYVIESGLRKDERIVLDGVRQVHDGEKVEYEFSEPEVVLANLKFKAE